MNNNQFLNEDKYQNTKKKVNLVGTILLITGIVMAIFGIVMTFGFNRPGFFFFTVFGMAFLGFGAQAKMIGHGREIAAFMAQSQIPVAKEGIEEMAPTIGKAGATIAKEVAPAYGEIAKEVSKGIKEGLKDEEK